MKLVMILKVLDENGNSLDQVSEEIRQQIRSNICDVINHEDWRIESLEAIEGVIETQLRSYGDSDVDFVVAIRDIVLVEED